MSKILLIYDEIGYWGTTAKDVAQFLVDNKGESVEVHINSPGGDVFEAFAIYNNLKNTPDCTIYIDGIAASAAAIIALCGHPLKMANVSQLMLHSASTYTSGNKKDMEEQISFLDSIDTTLASMIATKLGKEVDEVKNLYFDGKDHWISASECKEMGICEIWEPSPEDRANLQRVTACLRYTNINQKNNKTMLQKLQTVQAFMNCHTEDEAMVRINDMVSKNAELTARVAELEKTEQKYNDLMAQLVKEQKEADEKFIADAIKDGRISDDHKAKYEALMAKDRELAREIIDSLPKKEEEKKPIKKVEDFIKEDGVKCSSASWEARMKEIAEKSKR